MSRMMVKMVVVYFLVAHALMVWAQAQSPQVWGINAGGQMWRWAESKWEPVAGKMANVSVGSDGTVWAVRGDGRIYRRSGNAWDQVIGSLKQVSVGNAQQIWGVNASDDIFRWTGTGWQNIPGKLSHVSVASDGSVWGVNSAGNIYRRVADRWEQIPGGLKQISVGAAQHVWGVNGNDDIYRWIASGWQNIPGKLIHVSVAQDGTVWGVNRAGNIFRWATNRWEDVPGGLVQLSVAPSAAPANAAAATSIPISAPATSLNKPAPSGQTLTLQGGPVVLQGGNFTVPNVPAPSGGTPNTMGGDLVVSSSPVQIGGRVQVTNIEPAWQAPKSFPKGQLKCGRGKVNLIGCGVTNADKVGPIIRNAACPAGTFHDAIWGGTCWKFPPDDGRGTWLRGLNPVDKEDSVFRVVSKRLVTSAKREKEAGIGVNCGDQDVPWRGWDGWGRLGGYCWSCPETHPHRTEYPVYSNSACSTPLKEEAPAIFVRYAGCPNPDPSAMGLKGSRRPGQPFADVINGNCWACPTADENGDVLVTERSAAPVTAADACYVNVRFTPAKFEEPGVRKLAGTREILLEQILASPDVLNLYLGDLAKTRGDPGYVGREWEKVAKDPYSSEAVIALLYNMMELAAVMPEEERSEGEQALLEAFASYIQARKLYLAQTALDVYTTWYDADQAARRSVRMSHLAMATDYGTVPYDFQSAVSAGLGLGAVGMTVAGTAAGVSTLAAQKSAELAKIAKAVREASAAKEAELTKQLQAVRAARNVQQEQELSKALYQLKRGFVSSGQKEILETQIKAAQAARDARKTAELTRALRDLKNAENVRTKLELGKHTRTLRAFKTMSMVSKLATFGPALLIEVAGGILLDIAIEQFIEIQTAKPKLEAALKKVQDNPVKVADVAKLIAENRDQALYYWAMAVDPNAKSMTGAQAAGSYAAVDQDLVARAREVAELAKAEGYKVASPLF